MRRSLWAQTRSSASGSRAITRTTRLPVSQPSAKLPPTAAVSSCFPESIRPCFRRLTRSHCRKRCERSATVFRQSIFASISRRLSCGETLEKCPERRFVSFTAPPPRTERIRRAPNASRNPLCNMIFRVSRWETNGSSGRANGLCGESVLSHHSNCPDGLFSLYSLWC